MQIQPRIMTPCTVCISTQHIQIGHVLMIDQDIAPNFAAVSVCASCGTVHYATADAALVLVDVTAGHLRHFARRGFLPAIQAAQRWARLHRWQEDGFELEVNLEVNLEVK